MPGSRRRLEAERKRVEAEEAEEAEYADGMSRNWERIGVALVDQPVMLRGLSSGGGELNGRMVGTDGYCSPRHRMSFNSRNQGSGHV